MAGCARKGVESRWCMQAHRHLFRPPDASDRVNSGHLVKRLFAAKYLLQHLDSYCTRSDSIDSNTVSSVFDSRGLRRGQGQRASWQCNDQWLRESNPAPVARVSQPSKASLRPSCFSLRIGPGCSCVPSTARYRGQNKRTLAAKTTELRGCQVQTID